MANNIADINAHNLKYRNVQYVDSFKLLDFYNGSAGDMLITGGCTAQRSRAVCSFAEHMSRIGSEPVIIFSNSGETEHQLIESVRAGNINELILTSPEHRNYCPFYGMEAELCAEYFGSIAKTAEYRDTDSVQNYAGGFFNVLNTLGDISLATIHELMESKDSTIAQEAENKKDLLTSEMIKASPGGGVAFRRLVGMTEAALGKISDSECANGYSISNLENRPCVAYISTRSNNNRLMALYFIHELKQALDRSITVVFDDTILLGNREMAQFIEELKLLPNITVVVSCANTAVLPNIGSERDDNRAGGFSRHIIFVSVNNTSADLQRVLDGLGAYIHFQSVESVSNTPHIFYSLEKSETVSTITFNRPKLLIEEEAGRTLLRGHCGGTVYSVNRIK